MLQIGIQFKTQLKVKKIGRTTFKRFRIHEKEILKLEKREKNLKDRWEDS